MSTKTVIERIALEIVTRLESITTTNGYSFTVCSVVRPDRLGQLIVPEHYGIVVTQGDTNEVEELSHPGNPPAIAYETTFSIHCFVRDSDKNPTAFDPAVNEVAGQIVKALRLRAADASRWTSMAELAIDSTIKAIKPYPESDGTHSGVTIPLTVLFRHSEGNPYEVRA